MECRNNRGNGSYVSGPQVGIFSPKSSNLNPFFSIKFSITQADVTDLEWAEFSLEEWIMQVGAGGVVLIPAHPMHTRMTLWWDQHMSCGLSGVCLHMQIFAKPSCENWGWDEPLLILP